MPNGVPFADRRVRSWGDRHSALAPAEPPKPSRAPDVLIWNVAVAGLAVALLAVIGLLAVRWVSLPGLTPARQTEETAATPPAEIEARDSHSRELVSESKGDDRRSQRHDEGMPEMQRQLRELSRQLGETHKQLERSKVEQNALKQRLDEALAAKNPPVRDGARAGDDRRIANRRPAADLDDLPEDDDDVEPMLGGKGKYSPGKKPNPPSPLPYVKPTVAPAPPPPDPGPSFVLGEFKHRPTLLRQAEFIETNERVDALLTEAVHQRVAGRRVDLSVLNELSQLEKLLDERVDTHCRAHELTPGEFIEAKRYLQNLKAGRRYLES